MPPVPPSKPIRSSRMGSLPYQINSGQVSYNADRLPTNTEVNSYVGGVKTEIENEVNEVVFSWGHLT